MSLKVRGREQGGVRNELEALRGAVGRIITFDL
jgi:hypothetical protein